MSDYHHEIPDQERYFVKFCPECETRLVKLPVGWWCPSCEWPSQFRQSRQEPEWLRQFREDEAAQGRPTGRV